MLKGVKIAATRTEKVLKLRLKSLRGRSPIKFHLREVLRSLVCKKRILECLVLSQKRKLSIKIKRILNGS